MDGSASKMEAVADFLRANVKRIALAIALLAALSLLFGIPVKTTFVVLLLIIAASFSTFYFNYFRAPVNFELVKLSTILVAVSHGLLPGLAVGIASTFFGKVLIGRIDEKLPISILTISIIAVAAAMFNNVDITTLGITLVVAYNVTMFIITQFMGGDLAWNLPYEGTNLLFNVLLFMKAAPVLLRIVQ